MIYEYIQSKNMKENSYTYKIKNICLIIIIIKNLKNLNLDHFYHFQNSNPEITVGNLHISGLGLRLGFPIILSGVGVGVWVTLRISVFRKKQPQPLPHPTQPVLSLVNTDQYLSKTYPSPVKYMTPSPLDQSIIG